MTTTSQIRSWWGEPCTGDRSRVALYGEGVVSVRDEIVDATHALSRCLEHWGYATRSADTGAYNCRRITGGTGYSLHAYAVAIDINWLSNPYGPVLKTNMPPAMVTAIKAIRTVSGKQVWRWGGDYSGNKDAMHYEVVASPADLATGIDPQTIPGVAKPPPIVIPPQEDDDMLIITAPNKPALLLSGGKLGGIKTNDDVGALKKAGVQQVALSSGTFDSFVAAFK